MRAFARRHRVWRRRNSRPLLLVPYEPLAATLFAALVRALFRYRSELAPFTTASVLAAAGALMHHYHWHAWSWVVMATAIAALLAGVRGTPYGITRTEERVFAALATISAGGWLATATANGPTHRPLPALLVTGTVVYGVPWWAHRRRRARVRIDRTIQAWPDLAESIGLAGSRGQASGVGWAVADHLKTDLIDAALIDAIGRRRPPSGLVFHSDRGCQYTSAQHARLAAAHGIRLSNSRRGQCWDNAIAESFFSTVKTELPNRQPWPTHAAARQAIFEYIEGWYNTRRRHSSLGYLSPAAYEATTEWPLPESRAA